MTEIDDAIIQHLKTQFDRASPILFTGAGFSVGARNIVGQPLPLGGDLKPLLWNLCFPARPFQDEDSMQDLFEEARLRHGSRLKALLDEQLTVDIDSIPDW